MLGAILELKAGSAPLAESIAGGEPRKSQHQARERTRWAAVLLLLAAVQAHLGVPVALAADSPQVVSMPYSCRVVRGEVSLQRSPERIYRVVGNHDQQSVRLCAVGSTANCRVVEVHRFSFDCGGIRVPWIDAAESAPLGLPWRATVGGGRMTLHFWPGGPIRDRHPPLALPVGFAPAPASGLRFAPAAPPATSLARAGEPSPRAAEGAVLSKAVVGDAAELPPPIPVGAAQAAAGDVQPARPLPEDGDAAPSLPVMGKGWTATVTYGDDEAAASRWDGLPRANAALLAALGLAALLLSATAVAARQRVSLRKFVGALGSAPPTGASPSEASASVASAAGPDEVVRASSSSATPADVPPPPPPPRAARQPPAVGEAPRLVISGRPPPLPSEVQSEWEAVVEMRTTAGALLEIVRQIIADHVPDGALRAVLIADLASIADRLDGPELAAALADSRLDLVHPVYAQAILDLERVRTLARIEHQRMLEVAEPRRLPATFDEACDFLGVNPRASHAVVKKVVDALRQNWHPDLAGDEPERAAREERMKRINAAWDLIRAR